MSKNVRLKQISQETFDDCVQENIDEFDMTQEEAIADAIKQFEAQQVDLSNIIKHKLPSSISIKDINGHTLLLSTSSTDILQTLQEQLNIMEIYTISHHEIKCQQSLHILQTLCNEIPEFKIIAAKNNTIHILIQIIETSWKIKQFNILQISLSLLREVVEKNQIHQDFIKQENMIKLTNIWIEILQIYIKDMESLHVKSLPIQMLNTIISCIQMHEVNKTTFVKAKGMESINILLPHVPHVECIQEPIGKILKTLTIDDDKENQTGLSQTHEVIKSLTTAPIETITITLETLAILQIKTKDSGQLNILIIWLLVLKQLAISEENCTTIYTQNGLELIKEIIQANVTYQSVLLMKACIAVVRNLASADSIKSVIMSSGTAQQILRIMETYKDEVSIQSLGCSTLAALSLRSPVIAHQLVFTYDAARILGITLRTHSTNVRVLRAASLAIRNLVARSGTNLPNANTNMSTEEDMKTKFLQCSDLERILRHAQGIRGCGDEAYAALRDLGVDIQLASAMSMVETKANFNPTYLSSTALLSRVEEEAQAPF